MEPRSSQAEKDIAIMHEEKVGKQTDSPQIISFGFNIWNDNFLLAEKAPNIYEDNGNDDEEPFFKGTQSLFNKMTTNFMHSTADSYEEDEDEIKWNELLTRLQAPKEFAKNNNLKQEKVLYIKVTSFSIMFRFTNILFQFVCGPQYNSKANEFFVTPKGKYLNIERERHEHIQLLK